MKRVNKIISVLLAMLMVLSCAIMTTVTAAADSEHGAQPATWWSDNAAKDFAGGTGTAEDPYQISTPAEMAHFANYLEGGALNEISSAADTVYFILTADIDMSAHQWKPIGYTATVGEFFYTNTLNYGNFNGNNKKITGVKLTASSAEAELGYIYDNGCALFTKIVNSKVYDIAQLEVKILDPVLNSDFFTAYNAAETKNDAAITTGGVAALAGCVYGSSQVENICAEIDLDVRATGHEYVYAGLVATTAAADYSSELGTASASPAFHSCTVKGSMIIDQTDCLQAQGSTVKAAAMVGGVIGYAISIDTVVDQLANYASINVTCGAGAGIVAGVMAKSLEGVVSAAPAASEFAMKNAGTITVVGAAGGTVSLGGVYAQAPVLSADLGKLVNEGDLTVDNTKTGYLRVGGILASVTANAENDLNGYVNSGDITIVTSGAQNNYVGGILSELPPAADMQGVMSNCENSGKISITGANADTKNPLRVGGLAGYMGGIAVSDSVSTGDITIMECVNPSEVHIGGLIGFMGDGTIPGSTLSNCRNAGNVSYFDSASSTTGKRRIGGLVGTYHGPANVVAIRNGCVNDGNVYHNAYVTGSEHEISGIVAYNTKQLSINNTVNNGNVTLNYAQAVTDSARYYIAGILPYDGQKSTINYCENNGDISITGVLAGYHFMGGIVARTNGASVITNTKNSGDIIVSTTSSGASGCTGNYGGIVGSAESAPTITNVENSGDVSYEAVNNPREARVGGIVGGAATKPTITNAVNYGNVTGSNPNGPICVGGIAGMTEVRGTNYTIKFEDCTNYGKISSAVSSSDNATGGIVGRIGIATSAVGAANKLINCTDLGEVVMTEDHLSGGIVGYISKSGSKSGGYIRPYTTELTGCIGYGTGNCNALVGYVMADTTFNKCFGNTDVLVGYRNMNSNSGLESSEGVPAYIKINGTELTEGEVTDYMPANCAHLQLATLDMARIRLDADADTKEAGLRFDSYITKESYDEIKALTGVTIELGTLIAPAQNLNASVIASQYDKVMAFFNLPNESGKSYFTTVAAGETFLDNAQFDDPNRDQNNYFAGALVNIREANYNLSYAAIAYAILNIDGRQFIAYANYDPANADRQRSIAQVAGKAFEDRATANCTIDGVIYDFQANAANACYVGAWSPYSNAQLSLLKKFSGYVNSGETPAGLSINGVSIADYKIVYAQSPIYKTYGSLTGKTMIGNLGNASYGSLTYGDALMGAKYDYDYQTAMRLHDLILAEYGVDVPVVPDYDFGADASITSDDVITPETDYEILVGKTNRLKSQSLVVDSLTVDDYLFRIDDTKVIVVGGSYGATWHAVDALEALFTAPAFNAPVYNLKMAGDLSGNYSMKKLAFIGDSITRGSQALPDGTEYGGVDNATSVFGATTTSIYFEQYISYPGVIQRSVWQNAVVYNFGRGNTTVGNYPGNEANYYISTAQGVQCLKVSDSAEVDFDLVVMMHGTNDAAKVGADSNVAGAANWNEADKAAYTAEVQRLIDEILEGSPNAKFVLNNLPHSFDAFLNRNEANDKVMLELQTATATAMAAKYGTDVVFHYNMNAYTRENLQDGTCDCPAYTENLDTAGEGTAHGYYYNFNTPTGNKDGTHPNFRGYHKMAEGYLDVVNYFLFGGQKPAYMIDVA